MPKKTTRTRRDGKTRVNEAQLQAYRARKAETVAHPEAAPDAPVEAKRQATPSGVVTAWGHVAEEYTMIKADLVRLFIITAAMFVIILVLWFFLG
jgi:hypothetical protein